MSTASGIPLALDGDLLAHGDEAVKTGDTEAATRVLAARLELSESAIRPAFERGTADDFERTPLYQRTFALANRLEGRPLPHAIALHSPKFTRSLTTEWFAGRVDERYRRCLGRGRAPAG